MSLIQAVRGCHPKIGEDTWLAPTACLIGDIVMGPRCSVWYSVTIRADVMPIRIGSEVNIQDNSVLHGTYEQFGVTIEDRVTIGHGVLLHGCTIGRECLIGMGSIVMDGVEIGENSIIGAGSLITAGTKIPPRSLVLGRPGKVIRPLRQDEIESLSHSANNYLIYKKWYEG